MSRTNKVVTKAVMKKIKEANTPSYIHGVPITDMRILIHELENDMKIAKECMYRAVKEENYEEAVEYKHDIWNNEYVLDLIAGRV